MSFLGRLSDTKVAALLIFPILFLEAILSVYPIVSTLWMSFHDINLFTKTTTFVGTQKYAMAFSDSIVHDSSIVTLRFAVEVVILVTLLSIGVALILNQQYPFRGLIRVVVLLPWTLSEFATATVGRYLYSESYGFLNSILFRLGLIDRYIDVLTSPYALEFVSVLYSWHLAPLCIFFILAGLLVIPEELYKQAKVDGAGPLRRFRTVTFPFIKYSILMTMVVATIEASRSVDIIIVLTGGGPGTATMTLAYYIFLVCFRGLRLGYGAALGWLLVIVTFAAAMIYFKLLTWKRR